MYAKKKVVKDPEIFIQQMSELSWFVFDAHGKRLAKAVTAAGATAIAVNFGRRYLKWPKGELEKLQQREYQANMMEKELLMTRNAGISFD